MGRDTQYLNTQIPSKKILKYIDHEVKGLELLFLENKCMYHSLAFGRYFSPYLFINMNGQNIEAFYISITFKLYEMIFFKASFLRF